MAKIIRMLLLWPVWLVYGSIIFLRNKLFDWQIFKSQEFEVPIICIGNLEIGGSGKTPMTDFLISHFRTKYKIACLSRGYKRKSSGFLLATEAETVDSLGDEAFQIFKKWHPLISLAVDSDRRRGIQQILMARPDTQLILMDDGMQHRWVKPKILIQLTPFFRPFFNNHLLPVGNLRDEKASFVRAGFLVFTKAPSDSFELLTKMEERLRQSGLPSKPCFISTLYYKDARNLEGEILEMNADVVAVSGLANNQPFFEQARSCFSVSKCISKPDHYRYLPPFFDHENLKSKTILTTEKDFYKLIAIAPDPALVFYLPIEMDLYPKDQFLQAIEDQL